MDIRRSIDPLFIVTQAIFVSIFYTVLHLFEIGKTLMENFQKEYQVQSPHLQLQRGMCVLAGP